MMKIYVMRHGETDWNVVKRLQGRADIPLNQNGIELARKSGQGMADIPFTAAFTSPLKRARQTAELVLAGREIPIIEDERLIEISFGKYEGLCSSCSNYEIEDENFAYFFTAPERYQAPEGAESIVTLKARIEDFIKDITSRPELAEQTILLTTHGAAGRAIVSVVKGSSDADFWTGGVARNCNVYILESSAGETRVVAENQTFY